MEAHSASTPSSTARYGEAVVRETIAQRDSWMLAHIEGLDAAQLALLRQAADLLLEVSDA